MSSQKKSATKALDAKASSQSPVKPPAESLKSIKPVTKRQEVKSNTPSHAPVIKELKEPQKDQSFSHKSLSPVKEHANRLHHNPIDEIELKIKSRKRLLESLESQLPSINDEMLLQVSSRDSIIEEMNKDLVALRAQIKEAKKSAAKEHSEEKQEIRRLKELEDEKISIESKMIIAVDKYRNEMQKIEEDKLAVEIINETLAEENEMLRTQIRAKDEEVKSVIVDIQKLSEVIQQFQTLNQELNRKIEKQSEDFEEFTLKYYEAEVKLSNIAEIERSLQDYIRIYQQSEHRANKVTEELRTVQVMYDDIQGILKFTEEQIEKLLASPDGSLHTKTLQNLSLELKKKRKIDVIEINEHEKDIKIRELNEKLSTALIEIKRLENLYEPLVKQLNGTKELLGTLKKDHANSIENLSKTIKALQNYSDSMRGDFQSLRSDIAQKDLKITSVSTKLANSENKISNLELKQKKSKDHITELDKSLIETKQKLTQLKSMLSEKSALVNSLEKQNSKYVVNIQALHEEFWKKDTNLIKCKKSIALLQKSLSEATANKEPVVGKNTDAHEKLLKELNEKNQKIEILKEMVKASQAKKENKREGLTPDNSIHDMKAEKSQKISSELVSSLAVKTINKFFTICSFHRNSLQETPPDFQRLIKKLRQDLKSYNLFSVKDLQSSVSQLQYSDFDNKGHISLDELISVISKSINL